MRNIRYEKQRNCHKTDELLGELELQNEKTR